MFSEKIRKSMLDLVLLAGVVFLFGFAFKKLFFLLFPIALAYLLSEGIRKSFRRMGPISNGVRKILIILILLIIFALLSLVIILLAERGIRAVMGLSTALSDKMDDISKAVSHAILTLETRLSRLFGRSFENTFADFFLNMLKNALQNLAALLPQIISSLFSSIPRLLVSLVLFLIATYYFSCDWETISQSCVRLLKEERTEKLIRLKKNFFLAFKQYVRAYFLLFLLTFAEVFLGLVILRVSGAFSTAFFIALVDMLPVLGSGTVLLPWSLFAFLSGDLKIGVGLLILYAVIFLVRQFAEPKIIGSSLGLHPVVSLILVLAGLYFFGLWGMILFPMFFACLFSSLKKEA